MITYYCLCLSARPRCQRLSTLNMLGGEKIAGILIYVTDSGLAILQLFTHQQMAKNTRATNAADRKMHGATPQRRSLAL